MSASLIWIAWKSEIGLPNASRSREYCRAASYAAWAIPSAREPMLIRPVSSPESTCCIPRPSTPPSSRSTGTRTSSSTISQLSVPL